MPKEVFFVSFLCREVKKHMDSNYRELEKTIPSFTELLSIPAYDNDERLVAIDLELVPHGYKPDLSDMEKVLGKKMLLRESVLRRLYKAQGMLRTDYPELTLYVTYAYRSLEIQMQRFQEYLRKDDLPFYPNPVDLYNAIHPFIAVPLVAGHPTGGAVDITIKKRKGHIELDFGSTQYDYTTKDSYVFINTISQEAQKNRMLLRSYMVEAGFVPHNAEWWHFSYGDWDWAYHTKQPTTIYTQISYKDIITIQVPQYALI